MYSHSAVPWRCCHVSVGCGENANGPLADCSLVYGGMMESIVFDLASAEVVYRSSAGDL